MDDVFSTVVAIIMGAVLLFIMPVQNMMQQNQSAMDTYAYTELVDFTDRVRNTGWISEEMFQQLQKGLSATGQVYQLRITHQREDEAGTLQQWSHEEVLQGLEQEKRYCLQKDDFIRVEIKRQNQTLVGQYGGRIKDENY